MLTALQAEGVPVTPGCSPLYRFGCVGGEPDEVLTAEPVRIALEQTKKPVKAVITDHIPGAGMDLAELADAVIYSLGEGSEADCGDARIIEWNAAQAEFAIASPGKAALPERCRMPDQPVFRSEYVRKMIG